MPLWICASKPKRREVWNLRTSSYSSCLLTQENNQVNVKHVRRKQRTKLSFLGDFYRSHDSDEKSKQLWKMIKYQGKHNHDHFSSSRLSLSLNHHVSYGWLNIFFISLLTWVPLLSIHCQTNVSMVLYFTVLDTEIK